jgi:peptide deformylase
MMSDMTDGMTNTQVAWCIAAPWIGIALGALVVKFIDNGADDELL